MTYEPIQELVVENFGCVRHASFTLSPLHALIGPNDSGKSTALRALRTAAQFAASDFGDESNTRPVPFDPMLDVKTPGRVVMIRYNDGLAYRIWTQQGLMESVLEGNSEVAKSDGARGWNQAGLLKKPDPIPQVAAMRDRLTTATMMRFDPNALRSPSRQILAREPVRFLSETGMGLASVYQAINSRDVDAFVAIRDKVRELFPTVQNILVPTVENSLVVLQTRLSDGTLVQAAGLSEGLLYFLGYAALQYLAESHLFLVEEPENGLHPARISEVMGVLREISRNAQVVIATHSPLVANELRGDEISVVTRDPETGTRAVLLSDVPRFEESSKVYQTGEFWLSYSDGDTEKPLLTGTPRK